MSTRAIIKPGSHIVRATHPRSCFCLRFADTRVVSDPESATPYVALTETEAKEARLLSSLEAICVSYSQETYLEARTTDMLREPGTYRLGSASAVVRWSSSQKGLGCSVVTSSGPNLRDVTRLTGLILEGKIAPRCSHAAGQVKAGMPGLKESFHQLIEAAFRAFDHWRLA